MRLETLGCFSCYIGSKLSIYNEFYCVILAIEIAYDFNIW